MAPIVCAASDLYIVEKDPVYCVPMGQNTSRL